MRVRQVLPPPERQGWRRDGWHSFAGGWLLDVGVHAARAVRELFGEVEAVRCSSMLHTPNELEAARCPPSSPPPPTPTAPPPHVHRASRHLSPSLHITSAPPAQRRAGARGRRERRALPALRRAGRRRIGRT